MFMSSGNFHHYVRVRDESRHQIERTFAGYPGSSGQRDYLGLELAVAQLSPLVEKINFAPDQPRDEDKRLFVAMFLGAQTRLKARYAWWVHERYLKLAGHFGTSQILPALLDDLRANASASPVDANASTERLIETELELIAKLLGWDPRLDENGAKRPAKEVAREILRECGRELSTGAQYPQSQSSGAVLHAGDARARAATCSHPPARADVFFLWS
jgi:hypothetical protein